MQHVAYIKNPMLTSVGADFRYRILQHLVVLNFHVLYEILVLDHVFRIDLFHYKFFRSCTFES